MEQTVIYADETIDGIETVRSKKTLEIIGKSFVVDSVRYFIKQEKIEQWKNTKIGQMK